MSFRTDDLVWMKKSTSDRSDTRREYSSSSNDAYREAQRIKQHQSALFSRHKNAILKGFVLNSSRSLPCLPEVLPPNEAVNQALMHAIMQHNEKEVQLLAGPQNAHIKATHMMYNREGRLLFALYHDAMRYFVEDHHAVYGNIQTSERDLVDHCHKIAVSSIPDGTVQRLQKSSKNRGKALQCPDSQRYSFGWSPAWIVGLDDLYNKLLRFDMSYLVQNYTALPAELSVDAVYAHLQHHEMQWYQTQVEAYFAEDKKESGIGSHLLMENQRRAIAPEVTDLAWECYEKAPAEQKQNALICLGRVLPDTVFPVSPALLEKHRGDWSLLQLLFKRYLPQDAEDFYVYRVLLKIFNKKNHTLADWDCMMAAACDSNPLRTHFSSENLLQAHPSDERIPFYDWLYPELNASANTWEDPYFFVPQKEVVHNLLLHRWYDLTLTLPPKTEALLVMSQQTLRIKTVMEPSPPFLVNRKEAIEWLIRTWPEATTNTTVLRRKKGLLDLLLGPKAFEAQAQAAQWFYTPTYLLALQTYWTLLFSAQQGYQQLQAAHIQGEARHYFEKPIDKAHQEVLSHFLNTLHQTYHDPFVYKTTLFKGSCLEFLERAYQHCMTSSKNDFMRYALTLSPEDYSLNVMQDFGVMQEKKAYLQRVCDHLAAYPDDLPCVLEAFAIDAEGSDLSTSEQIACLVMTLETEKFLTPATFEKSDLNTWMSHKNTKENTEIGVAFMARGAPLALGLDPDWEACQRVLTLYAPCDVADEAFRKNIVEYAKKPHVPERWAAIIESLRNAQNDPEASFLESAIAIAKFPWYRVTTPKLKKIVEACQSLFNNTEYGAFLLLPQLLFPTPLAAINADDAHVFQWRSGRDHRDKFAANSITTCIFDGSCPNGSPLFDLLHALKKQPLFTTLNIHHIAYLNGSRFFETLLSYLPSYAALKTLNFSYTGLDDIGLKKLLDTLWKRFYPLSIETLNLAGNYLTDSSITLLLDYFPWGTCHTLDLSNNLISNRGAQCLLDHLKKQTSSSLHTIYWGEPASVSLALQEAINQQLIKPTQEGCVVIDDEEVDGLTLTVPMELPQNNTVDVLVMSEDVDNTLSDITTYDLSAEVSPWQSYENQKTLTLKQEDLLTENQSMDLLSWLETCPPTFTDIALEGQPYFTSEMFALFLQRITRFQALKSLSFQGMPLSLVHPQGNDIKVRKVTPLSPYMRALSDTLPLFPALEILNLRDIPLGKADAIALITVIPDCPSLELIQMDENAATSDKQQKIRDHLEENRHRKIKATYKRDGQSLTQMHDIITKPLGFFPLIKKQPLGATTPSQSSATFTQDAMIMSEHSTLSTVIPIFPESQVTPAVNITTRPPFVPHVLRRRPDALVVEEAPVLFMSTEREITVRLGKKGGIDYEDEFNKLVDAFIGQDDDEDEDNKWRCYYNELVNSLQQGVENYRNTDVAHVTASPNSAQEATGVLVAISSGIPIVSPVAQGVQFGVNQASSWNDASYREQMNKFYRRARKFDKQMGSENLESLLQRLAFFVALRYGDRSALLSIEQAIKDATIIRDFIGYGHTKTHPVLAKPQKLPQGQTYCEFTWKKMDQLMLLVFGQPTIMLPMHRADWNKTKAVREAGQCIQNNKPEPLAIPERLIAYPSEPAYVYDKAFVHDAILALDEQIFRKMLLNTARNYQKNWERLGFFEQKMVQWFYAHGGHHSMALCEKFEEMAMTQNFQTLLEEFLKFLETVHKKIDPHSGLRDGSLHTELLRMDSIFGKRYETYQSKRKVAESKVHEETIFYPEGHSLRDNTSSLFNGKITNARIQERQKLIETAKLIKSEVNEQVERGPQQNST